MPTANSSSSSSLPHILTSGVAEVLPDANSLAKLMTDRPIRIFLGIDPTGNKLTLGHGVVLRKLQQFVEDGHDVILLIGDATVRIGDPTGRDSTRPEITAEQIAANFAEWQRQAGRILDFSKITMRHNSEWLDKLDLTKLIKLLAQTTLQQLIERDMFQDRLKNNLPIFGHELIYPLLQGYDSVAMDVDLEIGGSDQTFNMLMGRHLQKIYHNKSKWVLTTQIINGLDGRKMSKSYGNFIALDEEANSMYAKLMQLDDANIEPYFTNLTNISNADLVAMQKDIAAGTNPMQYKKKLAWEITAWLHSPQDADMAADYFSQTVQQKMIPDNIPIVKVASQLTGLQLLQTLLPNESNSDLRRLLSQQAVAILPSEEKPTDPQAIIHLQNNDVVRVGKKRYFKLNIE